MDGECRFFVDYSMVGLLGELSLPQVFLVGTTVAPVGRDDTPDDPG